MKILKFSLFSGDAASVSIPLTMIAFALCGWFVSQAVNNAKQVGGVWYKQKIAFFAYAIIVAWVVAMLIVKSDYRPYDPKKDGVPKEQTDKTRISAEELIKK